MSDYETQANNIALSLWKEGIDNGLISALWASHMENCHAATTNAYQEGLTVTQWHAAARKRLY